MTMLVQRSFRTTQAVQGAARWQLRVLLLYERLDGTPTHELNLLSEDA